MTALWIREARRCAVPALVAAPGTAVVTGAVTGTVDPLAAPGPLLTGLPAVAAGIAAGSVVAGERLTELHRTSPTPYPLTVARRLAWVLGGALFAIVALAVALTDAGVAAGPVAPALAATVALVGVGVLAACRSGSASGASGAVLGAALLGLLLSRVVMVHPVAATVVLAVSGAAMLGLAAR